MAKVLRLHQWTVSLREAIQIQNSLRGRLTFSPRPLRIRTVAGVDVSYTRGSSTLYAAVVVMRLHDLTIVETASITARATFPYVPGLLSFREAPAILAAYARLRRAPDCVLCDGQGLAHPRRFGLACHLGLLTARPAVGCAKSRLVGVYREPDVVRGSATSLVADGEVIGLVLRTKTRVAPVFLSAGYRIGLAQARHLLLALDGGCRLPEPIRQAHLLVNALRCAGGRRWAGAALDG
ncbi:MAG: endonuclease V [Candidatus Methylomirabilales bacterium]